jgi:hypothetical protein
MFKHFFKKLNSLQTKDQTPVVQVGTATYEELYTSVNLAREASLVGNTAFLGENLDSGDMTILLSTDVELVELDKVLQIKGPAKALQQISDDIQNMEFLAPGDQYFLEEWKFLVTDGTVMSSKGEKFIALPPDEWLMMGCKFNDAISGYDSNPFTFYQSPFGDYTLPYGIEIFVTDLPLEGS